MNMCGLLIFGVDVEHTYGTAFYLALHFIIALISSMLSMGFYLAMAYLVPISYRGGPQNFYHCGVGYSNVLFGTALVFSYVGERDFNLFNLWRCDKKLIPWLYVIVIYMTIPDSSFLGHFCGLIAGVLIKFGGFYVIMPRYQWIRGFDETCEEEGLLKKQGYFPATDKIEVDFDAYIWTTIIKTVKNSFLKMRHRLFGYQYVPPPPEPIICPNAIELEDRAAGHSTNF